MLKPLCLDFFIFVKSLKSKLLSLPNFYFFFKIDFKYIGYLVFPYEF